MELECLASGGLAGAVLTQLVNFAIAERNTRRIEVRTNLVRYTPPLTQGAAFEPLRVSYGGQVFQALSHYRITLTNGRKSIPSPTTIAIQLKGAEILDKRSVTSPVLFDVTFDTSMADIVTASVPPLSPGDQVDIGLILNNRVTDLNTREAFTTPSWHYRGTEDIRFVDVTEAEVRLADVKRWILEAIVTRSFLLR